MFCSSSKLTQQKKEGKFKIRERLLMDAAIERNKKRAKAAVPADKAAQEAAYRCNIRRLYRSVLYGNAVIGILIGAALVSLHFHLQTALIAGSTYFIVMSLVIILPRPNADMHSFLKDESASGPPTNNRIN